MDSLKTLYVLQALSAIGKSSWVRQNALEAWTACRDEFRRARFGGEWTPEIASAVDALEIARIRVILSESQLAIADGCHTDLHRLREMLIWSLTGIRARVVLVRFTTGNPARDTELSIDRQWTRPEAERVPAKAILRMECELAAWSADHGIEVMTPEQALINIRRSLRPPAMSSVWSRTTTRILQSEEREATVRFEGVGQ